MKTHWWRTMNCLIVGCLKENLNFNVVHLWNFLNLWVEKVCCLQVFKNNLLVSSLCLGTDVGYCVMWESANEYKMVKNNETISRPWLLVVLWFHEAHDFIIHWIFNFLYCRNYFDFVSCLFPNPFMSCFWMLKFIMTLVFLLFMETRKQLRMHILFYGFRIR